MKSFLILKNLAELCSPMKFGLIWVELKTENFIIFFVFHFYAPFILHQVPIASRQVDPKSTFDHREGCSKSVPILGSHYPL